MRKLLILIISCSFNHISFTQILKKENCSYKHWYLDQDGDGHYAVDTVACTSPGFGWNLTSNVGVDPDDGDAFFPYDQEFLASVQKVNFLNGDTYLYYRGKVYKKDSIWVHFLDQKFSLNQIEYNENLPISYIINDILYTSKDLPFKQGTIQVGREESIFFTFDTVQIESYSFKPEFWKTKYNTTDLIPDYFCSTFDKDPPADLVNDISGPENGEIRELILSDVRYLQTWVCLYCEFRNLSKNVEVLKILTPPHRESGSGIHLNRDPKESLIEEVKNSELEIRQYKGTVKGKGEKIKSRLLKKDSIEYLPIPREFAKLLSGREFDNFNEFQDELWSMITVDDRYPTYFRYWNYTIHYLEPLYRTLDPYDIDNMIICTEKFFRREIEPVSRMDF